MFGWFKKAPPEHPFTDRVWIDSAARLRGLLREAAAAQTLLVAPFATDEEALAAALDGARLAYIRVSDTPAPWRDASITLTRADRVHRLTGRSPVGIRPLVFGHFPHPSDDRGLRESLAAVVATAPVYFSALDEPLMRRFGGDRTMELMQKLGMDADEPIEHTLVTQAMTRAREKVGEQVKVPREARSIEEWITRNLG
jgi:hypothetical protein